MIAKRIDEGCEYPRGYGFAYRDWMRNQAVCYPVGLNWLAGAIHEAWLRLRHGPFHSPDRFSRELIAANLAGQSTGIAIGVARKTRWYADGYDAGKQEGWRQALEQVERQITTKATR